MFKNIFLHFKKICIHKYWVGYYCFKTGIPVRGLLHDLSKFSPTEFWEGVKYYQGDSSPIDACKADKGYSKAWLHHRGRNLHHWVSWIDNFQETGGEPLCMPYEYTIEMFCDFLGAGRAYGGKNFSLAQEYEWWKKNSPTMILHPVVRKTLDLLFFHCLHHNKVPNKYYCKVAYEKAAQEELVKK